jgi:hypothetical protein
MKCPVCKTEFKDPSKVKGGKTSRRRITPEQQARMQAGRMHNADLTGNQKPRKEVKL